MWTDLDMVFAGREPELRHPVGRQTPTSLDLGFGTKWNKLGVEGGRKLMKTWWPGKALDGITH